MSQEFSFHLPTFLQECRRSSLQAYENLKILGQQLSAPSTQKQARRAFAELEDHFAENHDESMKMLHFEIDKLVIDGEDTPNNTLTILQLPSIFTPENWSFTFFEGLLRYQNDEFFHQTVAEIGCGNGWITLALAKKCSPTLIYGLDINPKAILCSNINLYLNALDKNGEIKYDREGKSLLDRVQFHTSDLLQFCLDQKIVLDRILGCIPQVLSPDVDLLPQIIAETASDESLYALSNYCAKQGVIEDQFGLGLIARTIEEAIACTKSNGKLILNLGGRPGKAVLERLFTRRGLKGKMIWQTKIEQAADTDIDELVAIETHSAHRFEFFMTPHSTEPISARTAQAYQEHGGRIYHALNVVEVELKNTRKLQTLFSFLKKEELQNVRSALDLDSEDPLLVEEKLSFLSRIVEKNQKQESYPYEDTRGTLAFRRHLAEFFRSYWNLPLSAKNILVAPNRIDVVKNIFTIYGSKKALVKAKLCSSLPSTWCQGQNPQDPFVLEAPQQCDLICKFISVYKPQLVVCSLKDHELLTQDSFTHLIATSQKEGAHLVLDISNCVEFSTGAKSNGVYDFLAEHALPTHVTLLCGLVHNRVFQDFELAFVISENETLLSLLTSAAELTYSRPSILLQDYYDHILHDLLSFRVKVEKQTAPLRIRHPQTDSTPVEHCQSCSAAFTHPAFQSNTLPLDGKTIRLDYGENALPAPPLLKSLILEGLARQNISAEEAALEKELLSYLQEKFGVTSQASLFLANGISPLFAQIALFCKEENLTLFFPKGTYGYFVACALFFKVPVRWIETRETDAFKITPETLNSALRSVEKNTQQRACIFLNAPVVNPTGQIYSLQEIENLAHVCAENKSFLVMDSIFTGLEFEPISTQRIVPILSATLKTDFVLLGGFSKVFAAGGLRFGYATTPHTKLQKCFAQMPATPMPSALRYAFKKFIAQIPQNLALQTHLQQQTDLLKKRAQILTQTLTTQGWDVLPCSGGLFLVAKPTSWVGKSTLIKKENNEEHVTINLKNIHEVLFYKTGILINGTEWTGLDSYCRFVLSVTESQFNESLEKLGSVW